MPIIEPLRRQDAPDLEEYFKVWDERMGYLPNALMTMARKPAMVKALAQLSEAVHNDCSLPADIRGLVGQMASKVHGCNYCLAHTAANSQRYGVADEKIAKMWEFESSALFSERERIALRFAAAAASVPNAVDERIAADLRRDFTDTEIVELMGIVAYYGWWNRWNSSLATTLEQHPREYAERHLDPANWQIGKHAPA
jgi:uncharacterized peroxidase-related enzyme